MADLKQTKEENAFPTNKTQDDGQHGGGATPSRTASTRSTC